MNNSKLKERRRTLRRTSTDAEVKLWSKLRNKQLLGYKFFRQYSVSNFIVDFYCPVKKLVIELDGSQHAEDQTVQYDKQRTLQLEALNIKIIRFWNTDVTSNLNLVLEKISSTLELT